MWSGAVLIPRRSMLWNHRPRSVTRSRICSGVSSTDRFMIHLVGPGVGGGRPGQQAERLAVAVHRPHVDVGDPGADGQSPAPPPEVLVDERSDVLIPTIAFMPESVQISTTRGRRLVGSPT